jgi:hypothetical protein
MIIETIQYEVEGEIDFFKELKNINSGTNDDASSSAEPADISNRCLITDEVLCPDAVTLNCGHKFNYIPLYKEVLYQKCSTLPKNMSSKILALYTKTVQTSNNIPVPGVHNVQSVQTVTYNSSLNLETTKLHYDEIKCPYCRAITPKLLPYYPYPDVNQIKYVNSPSGLCLKGVGCEYYKMFPGKDKNKSCVYSPTYSPAHGLLCKTHTKKVISKENKVISYINPHTLHTDNTIYNNPAECGERCEFLLLTGDRKGQPCGCRKYKCDDTAMTTSGVSLCKRHLNMKKK